MTSGPPLNEKETRVLDKLQYTPGLVLAHGLGTGKTRTSIQVAKHLNMPTDVVVPASLQDNYKKEFNKWIGGQPANMGIESQQAAGRRGDLKYNSNGLLIVDEAHRAREQKSQLLHALKKSRAQKRLLLTATPAYNHPSDIAPLVNLAANKSLLPENRSAFNEKYVREKVVKPGFMARLMGVKPGIEQVLKRDHGLTSALKKYVDYEPGSTEGFPTSKEQIVKVPITKNQQDIYNTIMGKAPMWVRWKVNHGLPPGKGELQPLQAFLTGARQVANSNWDFLKDKTQFDAPKAQQAATFLRDQIAKNPNYKGVVYSNYLGSGLAPYKNYLDQYKIPYGEFSGDVNPSVRNQLVRDYNANKLKALLISSAGAEGLDLKGTRVLQILEPHFNREKEKQVIGRAIRYKSHEALPPEEQNVTIQRYLAQPTANWFDKLFGRETVRGTDEYISDIADRKERLNQQLIGMLARNRQ